MHPLTEVAEEGPVARFRRAILESLDGPAVRSLAELPHRWPLTRMHLRLLVDRLRAEGLVEFVEGGGSDRPRRLRLTEAGRRSIVRVDETGAEAA
jgi:DNA-binding MarR family transcriptional regulator